MWQINNIIAQIVCLIDLREIMKRSEVILNFSLFNGLQYGHNVRHPHSLLLERRQIKPCYLWMLKMENRTTNTITKCSLSWRMLIYRGTQCADKVNRRRCKMHHNTYIYMFLATMMIWWLRHHGTTVRWCNLYDLTMKSLPS